jgi:hypothetical protein
VLEFGNGLNISAPPRNFLPRLQAVDLTKIWIVRAAVVGCQHPLLGGTSLPPWERHPR